MISFILMCILVIVSVIAAVAHEINNEYKYKDDPNYRGWLE